MSTNTSGAIPSSLDKRDYVFKSTVSTIPSTFSLKELLQPIRNQGNTQTCAAQVGSCIKEYQERIDINFKDQFSPQYIFDNRSDLSINGMTGRDMMKILLKKGIVPEKLYPFGKSDFDKSELESEKYSLEEVASNFRIGGYATVRSINDAKAALIQNGPIYVSFMIYNTSPTPWKPETPVQMNIGGHAMTIVGYDETGFIIRNSWGKEWSSGGYTIYPYSDWGLHWEIYTTIDLESNDYIVPELTPEVTPEVTTGVSTESTSEKEIKLENQGCCVIS